MKAKGKKTADELRPEYDSDYSKAVRGKYYKRILDEGTNVVTLRRSSARETKMKTRFTYYQEDDMWIGWLEEYPDYRTQGETLAELKENLKDIYDELTSGRIPSVRKVGELVV